MADENTEGTRKRKSTSGLESNAETPQTGDEHSKEPGETDQGESFEPSAKCQKTSTNLEISPDTQTTQSAMILNKNIEGNDGLGMENAPEEESNGVENDQCSECTGNYGNDATCENSLSNDGCKCVLSEESAVVDENEDIVEAEETTAIEVIDENKINEEELAHISISSPEPSTNLINNECNIQTPSSTHSEHKNVSTPASNKDATPTHLNCEQLTPESLSNTPSKRSEMSPETPKGVQINNHDILEAQNDDDYEDGLLYESEGKDTCGFPPVITITFSDNDSISYKPAFLNFINEFTDLKVMELSNAIHLFNKTDSPDGSKLASSKGSRKKKRKAKKELFIVDTNPTLAEEKDRVKFSSKFKALEEGQEEEVEVSSASLSMCFNCDGNHGIKDCPLPKDFIKIRLARQKFKANNMKSARYHLEEDQKFSHLRPGRISSKLREALGLGKYEVPAHVYKMRVLGYPPGWLEEAKVVHSNISMFDIEGKNVRDKASHKRNHLDPERIVNYAGFNVEMERGCRDQNYQYGVPPYSKIHAKEAMIKFVNNIFESMEDNLETCDMEIDIASDKEMNEENPQSRTSPTLTDLETQKKQLLAELVCDGSNSSETEAVENRKEETTNKPENNGIINLVKHSMVGTPILKSASPYARLPKMDNFMKDVSPVINFENLPNSTGKYEQMTGVLDKVRKTLKNIQEKT